MRRTRVELEGGAASPYLQASKAGSLTLRPVPSRSHLIISVKEARKLLGKDAKQISDSQVEEQIALLSSLAEDFLQDNSSKV